MNDLSSKLSLLSQSEIVPMCLQKYREQELERKPFYHFIGSVIWNNKAIYYSGNLFGEVNKRNYNIWRYRKGKYTHRNIKVKSEINS